MRRMVLFTILMLVTTTARGEIFNTDAVEISDDMTITIKNMDVNGTPIDLTLSRYVQPSDPWSLYWKYDSADIGLQMKTVHMQSFTYDESEPLDRHQLDVYYTDNYDSNRLLFFVPGGAWRQGDKSMYSALGNTLAGFHDLTVVIVNYRLSDKDSGDAVHPDHVMDVARAFAWVRNNIKPSGIYLMGHSAGAHLASLLATDPYYLGSLGISALEIKGVISMSGLYYLPDFVASPDNPLGITPEGTLLFKKVMTDTFGGWSDKELVAPSPQSHIRSDQPPFLLICSYDDITGFRQSAENFVRAVKALDPAPEISLRGVEFSDYSDEVWQKAVDMASNQQAAFASYAGHWAEIMAINQSEPDGYVTRLIAEFLRSH